MQHVGRAGRAGRRGRGPAPRPAATVAVPGGERVGEQVRVATTAARRRAARGRRSASGAAARPGTTCPARAWSRPPGAKPSASRPVSSQARARLSSPSASMVHSARVHVVDRHEGRLAALGEAHVAVASRRSSTARPSASMRGPLRRRCTGSVTRGSSWTRRDRCWRTRRSTSHGSVAPVIGAAEAGSGRAGEGDVALAGEQAGGRVEADPAGAGQVDLAPGVQVGEVGRRARPGRRAASSSAVSCTR